MRNSRHNLRLLNVARTIAVTTLLIAVFTIEVAVATDSSLRSLYFLTAAAYGTILLYASLDRLIGERPGLAVVQVSGDTVLVAAFVVATGGGLSPLSFLFALPVMVSAALLGLRGGTITAGAAWLVYVTILTRDSWVLPAAELPLGRALYAGVSHLLGFLLLGALGGKLADLLHRTDRELRERQGALAALEELHTVIVESINTGLMTTDLDGRVTFVNQAGTEILAREPRTLVGSPAAEVFGLPGDFLERASKQLRAGRKYRFERHWTRASDGARLLVGFSASELRDPSGSDAGWLIVFQDLTELASLEQQVRTKERMAALGEMAAGMAHELRNPLAAVTGCVQVLGSTSAGADAERLRDIVLHESRRLDRIIKDFLEFAKPTPFRPRPTDLAELMSQLAHLLGNSPQLAERHSIEVLVDPGSTLAAVDPDAMRQLFWNLASNALKSMPEGGLLRIRVSQYGAEQVMVAFEDQGHGMDEETARRYFQPFQSRFRDGTGLGAAIVYRIVEDHGGRVHVVSRLGQGTQIRVLLPTVQASKPCETGSASDSGTISETEDDARQDRALALALAAVHRG
ncbi:MAG: PAS domain-containing protein [Acidobacteriota bacterium]|nr:MAG: PAS domain-containing protein [Acidobacteriota bacterium]